MGWADRSIKELEGGKLSKLRPLGNSMAGRIESGQLITLDPSVEPKVNDAVLCRVNGHTYVHLVKSIRNNGNKRQYLIGNNKGRING